MKATNLQVWLAGIPMAQLGQVKLPVRTALAVAKLQNKLADVRKPIEEVRKQLVEKHAEKDEHDKPIKMENGNIKLADSESFSKEFDALMAMECDIEFAAEKIKLPERVSATCDKCHHSMDRAFEIEPGILAALEPWMEVA